MSRPEDFCGMCGGRNPSWHAASPLWNAVMRSDGREPFDGIICPNCFGELARRRGVTDRLCVTTHDEKVTLPTIFGDGRVWDRGKCMWVDAFPPANFDRLTVEEQRRYVEEKIAQSLALDGTEDDREQRRTRKGERR